MPPEFLQFLQQLMGGGRPQQPQAAQPNVLDVLRATDPDPVGTANKLSSLPSTSPGSQSPFATGFFNPENSASSMSPEARLASQGRSATNMWAQMGGMPGIDGGQVGELTNARRAPVGTPARTDVGEVQMPEPIPVAQPMQVGSWVQAPGGGFELLGPTGPGSGGGNVLGSLPPGSTPASMPLSVPPRPKRKPSPFGGTGFSAGAGAGRGFAY